MTYPTFPSPVIALGTTPVEPRRRRMGGFPSLRGVNDPPFGALVVAGNPWTRHECGHRHKTVEAAQRCLSAWWRAHRRAVNEVKGA